MNTIYFSEREHGPKPRTVEQIAISAWGGIVAAIRSRIADGSFGYRYPDKCPDGGAVSGCDNSLFMMAMKAEFPDFLDIEGFSEEVLPDTLVALDLLEFCYRVVAKPIPGGYHSFYRHDHLSFDPEEGQKLFRIDINRILARNSLVFEINPNGQVIRLAPPVLQEALTTASFVTGDATLDSLLESARSMFLSPKLEVRSDAVEKLWGAWERFKTIEPLKDKKASIKALINKTANESKFRDLINTEALELTRVGNEFTIRHKEKTTTPITKSSHFDYLFHRLFALIHLLLVSTGRLK